MRITQALSIIGVFALLVGNAAAYDRPLQIRTSKPGGTARAFRLDSRDCFRDAWHGPRGPYGPNFNQTMALHCMALKGYVKDPKGFVLKLPG